MLKKMDFDIKKGKRKYKFIDLKRLRKYIYFKIFSMRNNHKIFKGFKIFPPHDFI